MNASTSRAMLGDGTRTSLLSSQGRGWQGFGAEVFAISAGTHRMPAFEQHRIGVHIGKPVRANCICDGKRHARVQAHGDADVVPAGMTGEWADEADCTVLSVWIDDAFAGSIYEQLELKHARAGFPMRLQMRDPRFQHLAWGLHAELQAEDASDSLFAESLCTGMLVRLLGTVPALERKRRALTPKAAARVADFIDSGLDRRLTLAELAALLDMSIPHFKVLFRETFGVPAHRYVVQRRVERAKALLLTGACDAAQVAAETGFSHQSHMAYWMRRILGASPRELTMKSKPRGV
ncbi:AraC family transcriptional regulator [Trinickia dabaoshanensis]|uniref:AraC family transcriptional regulator n=1 Tax=Trinickia dabaoshanensis TaxID=564714 RepID=A0A2N7VKK0_9BURK|nr:AraC family transcriptional regulator [Trinickia dabaoshanensis]PMS17653.1 AraC family transcriptional regulator [Trinickia dabaoshanensis]